MVTSETYLGNPMVKRDGITQQWTTELIQEYAKCMHDPVYFTEKYIKVISLDKGLVPFNLYQYQSDMFAAFNANRFNIVLACRQSGKSISACAYLLWYGLFHSEKTIVILANKGDTAREMLSRITLMLENIPFFLQPGCKALNKGSIEFSNNSRILARATSGSSVRGLSVNLLYLDEFAFVERATEFYTSTYPVIAAGTTTKVIITSTANGIGNTFQKIWEGAIQGVSEFKPFRVDWWDVPGRDANWKKQTVANTSQLQFDQEFGNCLSQESKVVVSTDAGYYNVELGTLHNIIRSGDTLGFTTEQQLEMQAEPIAKIWITYKITNTENLKFYIGKTYLDKWNKGYMGSGIAIKAAVKKYPDTIWDRKILSYHLNEDDAYLAEALIVGNVLHEDMCYNIAGGGSGVGSGSKHPFFGKKQSDESNLKRSISLSGQIRTKSAIENYKKAWTPERRATQAALIKSKPGTTAGRELTDEHKLNISNASRGEKNGFYGKKHPTIECPHCQKTGSVVNMRRWHFDNCKVLSL